MTTPTTTAHALTAEDVTRVFRTGTVEVAALRGVTLAVAPGELLVVRGPSGSGKTTLLNVLGGLDRPTTGRVVLGGEHDLSALPEDDVVALRRTRIGYVFQSFGLIPVLSAAENVEVPLRLLEVPVAERAERVARALETVGLAAHGHQRPGELSGGQQQRVGIARALVAEPAVLLADEPTGQLDTRTAGVVADLVRDLTHRRGVAAVVTTHDPVLMERADRVVDLRDGRLTEP